MTESTVAPPSTLTHLRDMRAVTSLDTAEQLQRELNLLGISSEVHDGYGLALVSVRVGLVVWCDCERFWWRTGWDAGRKRAIYAWHSVLEPARAARRIAHCHAALSGSGTQPCL